MPGHISSVGVPMTYSDRNQPITERSIVYQCTGGPMGRWAGASALTCQILLSWSGTPLTPGNSGRPDNISTNMHPAPLLGEGRGGRGGEQGEGSKGRGGE